MIRYLQNANTGVCTSIGSATVQLTPSYGQYWAPRIIRIGMNMQTANKVAVDHDPILLCNLYHGMQGDTGLDAFVDSTIFGISGDITSIMNGMLIQPGEYLTAQWSQINVAQNPNIAGGTAYLEIDGLVSDTLNDVAELSAASVPGARFAGQPPSKWNPPPAANLGIQANFNNPGAGNSVQLLPNLTTSLYIYQLNYEVTSTVVQCAGIFITQDFYGGQVLVADEGIPQSARIYDFRGLRSSGGGLFYTQQGPTPTNTFTYNVAITYRIPFPPFS